MSRGGTRARARLRKRQAKLDARIARVKRKIKSLTKTLRTQNGILSRTQARRKKLK
jgi:hypothetical protein